MEMVNNMAPISHCPVDFPSLAFLLQTAALDSSRELSQKGPSISPEVDPCHWVDLMMVLSIKNYESIGLK